MITRIEIHSKTTDARANVRKKRLSYLPFVIKDLLITDVYTIEKELTKKQLVKIASTLSNPITQKVSFYSRKRINSDFNQKFDWVIETGFLPGVTDNIANTAREGIEDLLKIKFSQNEGVYTSQMTFISGKLSQKEINLIAESLFNPLIQRIHIKSLNDFVKSKGMDLIIPKVNLGTSKKVMEVNLNVDDEKLKTIGKQGIKDINGNRRGPLALDLMSMKAIQKYFKRRGRKPTDIELESIAQTWSEHCKHTIFADPIDNLKSGLFKTYIKAATDKIRKNKRRNDFCVSVFTDNSGAIEFDDKYLITHKVETHNSPSALDPFGGAITGIVGVNRDAIGFGLGAKPIINTYGFCFADPFNNVAFYKGQNFTQKMLSARRIMDGVIDGVNSGGNCSGIPTPQGFIFFDNRFRGKPLVFVGTIGLIPKKINRKKSYLKKAKSGDYIVMIGGKVGQDGIHGATFSSEVMDSGSPATAVQIGDPITQKKLSDAVVKEARGLNLYNSITDNGAGGLSCSVAEMAKEAGGCIVEIEKVPVKYAGLAPWQIWISESQERMTLAIPPKKWKKFLDLMEKRGVEATKLGKFTNSGKCLVKYKNKKIMDLDMKFLHNGLPQKLLKTTSVDPVYSEPIIKEREDLTNFFYFMLKRLNLAGFEYISSQYDYEVQGGSVIKPIQGKGRVNVDTSVVKPILNSQKGIAISQGLYPTYSDINTYHMAACCIDTAVRNVIVTGADIHKIALLDNFCWCSSNEPERLAQLKNAVKACYDYAVAFKTPFISGKDSMFNDFKGFDEKGNHVKISIPPTLLVSSIGIINDVSKVVSLDIKFTGDLIYVLGETYEELGASEYYALISEQEKKQYVGNSVPKVNVKKNKKLYQKIFKCIGKDLISSAISVNRGGLGVALAKMAMGGMLGIDVSIKDLPGNAKRNDFMLFSESQGRIVVTINPKNKKEFEKIIKGNPFKLIGKALDKDDFIIKGFNDRVVVNTKVEKLLKEYKKTFRNF